MTKEKTTAYAQLLSLSRTIALVESTSSLLAWDQETYMPAQGLAFRAEQLAYLAGQSHQLKTSAQMGDLLEACRDEMKAGLLPEEAVDNCREWSRDYQKNTRLPRRLVQSLAEATCLGRQAWVQAREESNFSHFQPALERIVALTREKAGCLKKGGLSYDALLDDYEPEAKGDQLEVLFSELREAIVELLPLAQEQSKSSSLKKLRGKAPLKEQEAFNHQVAVSLGFNFEAGRHDVTAHPFCTGLGPHDTRITTRYNEEDFTESLFIILHETGHGLYHQGLCKDRFGSPAGEEISLGIHESQSRLWENQVGRSPLFWHYWYPIACKKFPHLKELPLVDFLKTINRVEPSFIRVDADELTYNLHIILRFEIERALFDGDLSVADLPEVWNEKFQQSFGLTVSQDREGCLQDIHWSAGLFGYFPTYTLGNLYSAQLFEAAVRQVPQIQEDLAQGKCHQLLQWLREKVHSQGRRLSPQALIKKATGELPSAQHLIHYFHEKYGKGA